MNRVLCQPGVQIIHAKPQLVTLQMTKAEPGVVSVTGLTPQNIAIVSQVPPAANAAPSTPAVEPKVQQSQVVGLQPNAQIISQLQPVQLANSLPMKQIAPLQPETTVIEKPLLQQHLQHQIFIQVKALRSFFDNAEFPCSSILRIRSKVRLSIAASTHYDGSALGWDGDI